MKKLITILLLLAIIPTLKAQITDTATWVVDQYLERLNYFNFPLDTTVYIQSTIVNQHFPNDTTIMKRWYARPHQYRTEIWAADTLQYGAYGNGTDYFCVFNHANHHWDEVRQTNFYEAHQAYDFRGPLYDWKGKAAEFQYMGIKEFQGIPVYQIRVQTPGIYDRDYFFEKSTGLFFMFNELTSTLGNEELNPNRHVDWRACHEFTPIGNMLFPTIESYQTHGSVVVIRSQVQLIPYNYNIFNRD